MCQDSERHLETLGSPVHVLGRAGRIPRVQFKDGRRCQAFPGATQLWGQDVITGQAYPPLPLVLAAVPGSPEL